MHELPQIDGAFDRQVVDCEDFNVEQSDIDYPNFDDAIEQLQDFLRGQSLSSRIQWIGAEDCALEDKQLYVRLREPLVAEGEVRAVYAAAVQRVLGVKLAILCEAENMACCYVFAPSTELEAEHALMPKGLKLSVPAPVPKANIVEPSASKKWDKLCARPERRWIRELLR